MTLRQFPWDAFLTLAVLAVSIPAMANAQSEQHAVVPIQLGHPEPGEIRWTLTPEELSNMGIKDMRSLGVDLQASDPSAIAEVGILLTHHAGHIEGRIKTALGTLQFRSLVQEDAKTLVEFDLGRDVIGMLIDDENLVAIPLYSETSELTPGDKFVFKALAVVLQHVLGAEAQESDVLVRTVNLWGELVPVGRVREFFRDRPITPSETRSWTNICGWSSANLCHDAAWHSTLCYNVAVGPRAYRCRGRCGSGCGGFGTSAWTIDCGEHDHCLELHPPSGGLYEGHCGDEARAATDDFAFAPNCRRPGW